MGCAPKQASPHILAMAQRTEMQNEILEQITARILSEMRPWRVVLFGSRARGDAKECSDYDIYLEIDGTDQALRAAQSTVKSLCGDIGCELDVHARRPGQIDQRRDDPGTIEWDVAREGRILYASESAPPITPRARVREPMPNPPHSMAEWIEAAERDLRHRQVLQASGDDFSPDICWLSQQTCEKYMKALLVSRWVRPRQTHDLTQLLTALRAADCELTGLDTDCALLGEHAIKPRYPEGLKLGRDDARLAMEAADRVVEAVRALLPHTPYRPDQ